MTILLFPLTLLLAVLLAVLWSRHVALRREAYIRGFTLPPGLFAKLREHHPQLTQKDCQLVAHGLRQFFLAHLKSGRQYVSMPSQVADDLWHEFILYTRHYAAFCQGAFGRFMHHTPAVALGADRQNNSGLRRCWWQACREEHIDPRKPTRLPLLFALDAKLGIAGGFTYAADCEALRRKQGGGDGGGGTTHCGGDFSSSDADGSTDGFGDGDGSGSGGDGGGCGGGGD
jgi:hypothetical protein